jgi:flagellar protein FlaG
MINDISTTLTTQAAKDPGRESRKTEATRAVTGQPAITQVSQFPAAQPVGSTQAVRPTASSLSKEEVTAAVAQMKDFAQVMSRQLQFDVDDDSGRTVVRVLDKDSGDIIRQIPSEEVLALAKHMKELMDEESAKVAGRGGRDQPVGLLVKTQA